ncbi:MAG TPA: hypothetical protein VIM00_16325 [Candidatus Acidoferrum sp.]
MNSFERFLSVGALAILCCAGASADTLELKDGRVLEGKYLGGTQVIIRFDVGGDVQTFRVREITAVTFDRGRRRDRDGDRDGDYGRDGNRQDNGAPPPPPDQTGPGYGAPPPNGPNDAPDQPRSDNYPQPGRDDLDRDQGQNRDDARGLVYAAPGTNVTVPAGKMMLVRMIDSVDSRHNQVDDTFHASLETDLAVDNVLIARRGADVYGRLVYAKEAGHMAGSSELQLELTRIIIDGKEFPLVTGEYTLKGRGRGADTARKVGGGAVVGAIIGGVAGGGTGAAIGAGVGSAAGAGVQILTRGHDVRVPSETLLEFRLDQPVNVIPTQN